MTTSLSFPPPFFHASPRPCRAYSRQSPIILLPLNSSPICSLRLSSNSFHQRIIRRLPPIMSSAISQSGITELSDESDFHSLLSPSGLISICGFGSLLSERSARSTFPDLANFRVARLNGFRRVFAHVAPIFFERGIAKPETKEISSLSVEPCEGETLIVTVFEIDKSEIPAFMERELEFRFLAVVPETIDGKPFDSRAVLCAHYSDEEFFQIRCQGSREIYFQHYGSVLAAKNLGRVAHDNFLDHTFLGDRKTTIREYLATTGAGIMEEEPPESLKTRYGG
ncbi:uncharacterized protein LOC110601805 isoform X2 [Manihot esculenta]|uniref:Uncharacterized protein n=1 Tax=Manihot esculenta TaxID=3983 RepID=A0A2C9UC23_MANES|nr:uncharacterized protein LOC110601805 isoform X2 [Manihot esculenta]